MQQSSFRISQQQQQQQQQQEIVSVAASLLYATAVLSLNRRRALSFCFSFFLYGPTCHTLIFPIRGGASGVRKSAHPHACSTALPFLSFCFLFKAHSLFLWYPHSFLPALFPLPLALPPPQRRGRGGAARRPRFPHRSRRPEWAAVQHQTKSTGLHSVKPIQVQKKKERTTLPLALLL